MADAVENVSATLLNTKWYEETPGVTSSKRLIGGLAFAVGGLMKVIVFIAALFPTELPNLGQANSIADGLLVAGGSLLGLTALDVFKKAP